MSPLRALLALAAAAAVHSVRWNAYLDENCTDLSYPMDIYLGYCVGGLGISACNSQQGWATFVSGTNSNECNGVDLPVISFTATTSTCRYYFNWGGGVYVKLGPNPVCDAPGGVAPLAMSWYDGPACEQNPGEANRPFSGAGGWWIPEWSLTPGCYRYEMAPAGNGTAVSVDATTGAVSLLSYGAANGMCTGPVFASWTNITLAGGCKTPSTGNLKSGDMGASIDVYPQKPLITNTCPAGQSAVPGVASALPTMSMIGPTPSVASGVRMVFYADDKCTIPWGSGGPAEYPVYGGYCQGGIAVTGCNAALGWATVNWHAGNAATRRRRGR